ncbi:glycosyltransferase [Spirobacillus cienkowskii]|uniref:glycosyltransferase n=1 Tax=Spirobacillus cienkowskii TaxID=495820 RepID=UPI0030D4C4A5
MTNIKITLITVCYNSEKTIEDTLLSVVNQDYQNIEYIIIDGGSTDKTINIIKNYENKISKLVSEKDNGIYFAMNKGLKLATGDIIGFINSDDVFADNNVIKEISQKFLEFNCEIVYSDVMFVQRDNAFIPKRYWKISEFKQVKLHLGWSPPHPTFYARKELYNNFGFFDIKFKIAADYELMIRFLKNTNKKMIKYIPKVTVVMKEGGVSNNSIRSYLKGNIESALALKKNKVFLFFLIIFFKPFLKIKQFFLPKNFLPYKYIYFKQSLKIIGKIIDFVLFPFIRKKNYNIEKNSIQKILVNDCYLIGDNIMTTALMNNLKYNFPNAKIDSLANEWSKYIYSDSLVDKKYIVKTPWSTYDYSLKNIFNFFKKIMLIRKQKYDIAIETRGDWRNCFVLWLINAKFRFSPLFTGGNVFINKQVKIDNVKENLFEIRRKIALAVTANDERFIPLIPVSNQHENDILTYLKSNDLQENKFVVIHPCASNIKRMLSIDYLYRVFLLVKNKNLKVIFAYGPSDYNYITEIKAKLSKEDINAVIFFQKSLLHLAALIKKSLFCISMDSAVAHLAGALNKPIIVFNFHDSPEITRPFSKKDVLMINSSLLNWNLGAVEQKLLVFCSDKYKNIFHKNDSE